MRLPPADIIGRIGILGLCILGNHRRVEYMQGLVALDHVDYIIYLVSVVKIIKGGNDIISDGLSWVRIEFFVCRGVC